MRLPEASVAVASPIFWQILLTTLTLMPRRALLIDVSAELIPLKGAYNWTIETRVGLDYAKSSITAWATRASAR